MTIPFPIDSLELAAQQDSLLHVLPPVYAERLVPDTLFRACGRFAALHDITRMPYRWWTDDLFQLLVLLLLLLFVFVLVRSRRFLHMQHRMFFTPPRSRNDLFNEDAATVFRPLPFVIAMLTLVGGLAAYVYVQSQTNMRYQLWPAWVFFVALSVPVLLHFVVQHAVQRFVGRVFFEKSQQENWSDARLYVLTLESLVVTPVFLAGLYLHLGFEILAVSALAVVVVSKIFLLYKAYRIFFSKFYGSLHLIAYLCTLEVIPLTLLIVALKWVGEIMIIKY